MLNKHYRTPKWQSRIDNPETLATLGTQDTGRRETKYRNRIQHNTDHTKNQMRSCSFVSKTERLKFKYTIKKEKLIFIVRFVDIG